MKQKQEIVIDSKPKMIIQSLDEQGKSITKEELNIVLSFYHEFSRTRLIFELGAFVGLRLADIVNLKIPGFSRFEGFTEDFRTLHFIVSKPKVRDNKIKYKLKQREIPFWLADKLLLYYNNNSFTFKGGRLFPITKQHIWAQIYKLKKRHYKKYPFLKDTYQVLIYPNGKVQNLHRITFHTFRSFWIKNAYEANGKDLAKTARMIGHSNSATTYKYIRYPELHTEERIVAETKFNLPNQPKIFISKNQTRLKKFGFKF